eukprot:2857792-Prymnesium_polylepis.1
MHAPGKYPRNVPISIASRGPRRGRKAAPNTFGKKSIRPLRRYALLWDGWRVALSVPGQWRVALLGTGVAPRECESGA